MAREARRGGVLEGALMAPSEPDASVSGEHDFMARPSNGSFVPHDPENVGQGVDENVGQDVDELRLLVATVDAQISLAMLSGPESSRSSRPPEVPEVEPEPRFRRRELLAAEAEAPPEEAARDAHDGVLDAHLGAGRGRSTDARLGAGVVREPVLVRQAAGSFGRGLSLELNSSAKWSMVSSSDMHGGPDLPQVFRSEEHEIPTRTPKPESPHDGETGNAPASPEARTSQGTPTQDQGNSNSTKKGWHTLRNRWKSHGLEAAASLDTPRGAPRHQHQGGGGKHSHPAVEELRPWTDSLFRPLVPTPILQVGARGRVPRGGRRPPALEAIQG